MEAVSTKYDLERFIAAQADTYDTALKEIQNGKKESHWMWFIFPQISGLGESAISQYYAIKDIQEARAYMKDKLLATRLILAAGAIYDNDASPRTILGYTDSVKLKSCMTLFAEACPECKIFQEVLDKFYEGKKDIGTLLILYGQERK